MKKLFKQSSNQSGFTVFELMLVVGLISILAAVAKPAYDSHVGKSRTVEAIVAISTVHELMMMFHFSNGKMMTCLKAIGYGSDLDPSGTQRYYEVG